jgi:hypothetical protein
MLFMTYYIKLVLPAWALTDFENFYAVVILIFED